MTKTHSRVRRFRNDKWQFELYQGNYGNQQEAFITVRAIGRRGGLGNPFVPEWLDTSGMDYESALNRLARRVDLVLLGQFDPWGNPTDRAKSPMDPHG